MRCVRLVFGKFIVRKGLVVIVAALHFHATLVYVIVLLDEVPWPWVHLSSVSGVSESW